MNTLGYTISIVVTLFFLPSVLVAPVSPDSTPVANGYTGKVVPITASTQVSDAGCDSYGGQVVAVSDSRFTGCGTGVTIISGASTAQTAVNVTIAGICKECGVNDMLVSFEVALKLFAGELKSEVCTWNFS